MKRLLAAAALVCMAGCTVFQNYARREVARIGPIGARTSVLATTADVRLVTEHTRAESGRDISVLCTEPSPQTHDAIRLFQVVNKLPISGEFAAATLGALFFPANKTASAQQSVPSGGK